MPKPMTKPSAALRAAAKRIENNYERHTCYALDSLYSVGSISAKTRAECKRYVEKLLGRNATLETWLLTTVPECVRMDLWTVKNYRKVKQTRLAWIEWMAQQFEAQGR